MEHNKITALRHIRNAKDRVFRIRSPRETVQFFPAANSRTKIYRVLQWNNSSAGTARV